jgi:hypothetical protein
MIKVKFEKDYSKDFNIKFYGWIQLNIVYENGKVVSIKEKKKTKELLGEITKFKEFYDIKTDDVITIIDMYFANYFHVEYIGKPLF